MYSSASEIINLYGINLYVSKPVSTTELYIFQHTDTHTETHKTLTQTQTQTQTQTLSLSHLQHAVAFIFCLESLEEPFLTKLFFTLQTSF
jgi:response regulator RpfG family c-di-GMP phosphodiesterase